MSKAPTAVPGKNMGLPPNNPGYAAGFAGTQLAWPDAVMKKIVNKAIQRKKPIHGGKWQARRNTFDKELLPAELVLLDRIEEEIRTHVVQQYPPMANWNRFDFLVIGGPPGTHHQQWHMDCKEAVMIATLLVSGPPGPTELASIPYTSIDVADELLEDAVEYMGLKQNWDNIVPLQPVPESSRPKTLQQFWANRLHRGPAVPPAAYEDRIIFYLGFGPPRSSTVRFVDEEYLGILIVHTHTHSTTHAYRHALVYLYVHAHLHHCRQRRP